jgi:hypothetical protein
MRELFCRLRVRETGRQLADSYLKKLPLSASDLRTRENA